MSLMQFKASRWNILVLLIVSSLSFGLGYVAKTLINDSEDTSLIAVVITASVSLLSAVVVNTYGKHQDNLIKVQEDLRKKRTPLYVNLTRSLISLFTLSKGKSREGNASDDSEFPPIDVKDKSHKESASDGSEFPPIDAEEFWRATTPQMMMWASDDVFRQWSKFKRKLIEFSEGTNPPLSSKTQAIEQDREKETMDIAREMEHLFLLIRKDLGYHNTSFQEFDVVSLFINDIRKRKRQN